MEFIWPSNLSLLVVPVALAFVYVLRQRRRERYALRYATHPLARQAIGAGPGIRRHIPPVFFILGFAFLTVALARPQALVSVPGLEGTIILAIDTSGSMTVDDVKPNRMEAAMAAADLFVELERPNKRLRIGVVAFSNTARVPMFPTTDSDLVIDAINHLRPQGATAIGRAILASLAAIFPDAFAPATDPNQVSVAPSGGLLGPLPAPPPTGEFAPATIILLTDGENNQDPPPLSVVDQAVNRGVRIYTIGIGTSAGAVIHGQGREIRSELDEGTLKRIAEVTHAQYFNASSETDLLQIYTNLATQLSARPELSEITVAFAAAAALFLLLAGLVSLLWFHRLP